MTSGEQRENVATTVLFISGEDERMGENEESNPSKASAQALAYIYSGVIISFSPQQAFQFVYVALKKRNSLFKVTTVRLLLTTSSTIVLFTCAPRPSIEQPHG